MAKSVLPITILGGYIIASLLAGRLVFRGAASSLTRSIWPAFVSAAGAFVLHAWALYRKVLGPELVTLSLPDTLSLIGWLIAAAALLALSRPALRGLGALLLPLAGLCALATGARIAEAYGEPLEWTLLAHIGLSLTAYAALTIAAGLAVLMAVQDRRLRAHRPGGITSLLPPLETTERVLFGTIAVGFGILSLAVFSGLVFVDDLLAQHLAHKTVLSLLAWVVFAVLLLGRWRFGWRGRTAVHWTLGGFGSLALAYFGSRIVLEVLLGRHWG